jgi:hypothetical protein
LLVLVVVAIAFTGGMKNLWDQITGAGTQELSTATDKCIKICADDKTANKDTFCKATFVVKDLGVKACKELYTGCGVSCA